MDGFQFWSHFSWDTVYIDDICILLFTILIKSQLMKISHICNTKMSGKSTVAPRVICCFLGNQWKLYTYIIYIGDCQLIIIKYGKISNF